MRRTLGSPTMLKLILVVFLLGVLLPAAFGQARMDPRLVGEWTATVFGSPISVVFHVEASGRCALDEDQGTCQAVNGRLTMTIPGEGSEQYSYSVQGNALIISGGDMVTPLTFRRLSPPAAGSSQGPEPPREETATPPGQTAETEPEAPRPAAARATPQKRSLSEAELTRLLTAGVPNQRLCDLVEERGVAFTATPAAVARLKAKGASERLIATIRRAGTSAAAETAPSPPPQAPAARAASRTPSPGQPVPVGGPRFTQAAWGLSFVPPGDWKVADRQSLLLLGSNTEAGLMVVRFMRKASPAQIQQSYAEGLAEEAVQLRPAVPIQSYTAGNKHGLAGELAGISQDGSNLRARTIAVFSPYGDAVVLMGVTTDAKYAQLQPRVEQLAASLSFTQPQRSSAMDFLAGRYWYFSSSSVGGSYSSESRITLCRDGRFFSGSETYSSGGAGIAAGQGGSGGTWTAEGDESRGILTINSADGSTSQQEYQVSTNPADRSGYGPAVIVNGRKYQRTGDGTCN